MRRPFLADSEFVEVFVGRGAKRVRTLFDEAAARAVRRLHRQLDAWRRARGGRRLRGARVHAQPAMAAMDVTSTARVLVMGATNRLALDAPSSAPAASTASSRFSPRRGGAEGRAGARAARLEGRGHARAVAARTAGGRAPNRQPRERGGDRRGAPAATPSPRRLRRRSRQYARARAARAAPDTAADLDQFAANFMRGPQQASASAGGSIDDNE